MSTVTTVTQVINPDLIETAKQQFREAVDTVNSWEDPWMELYKRGVKGSLCDSALCPISTFILATSDVEVFSTPRDAQGYQGLEDLGILSYSPAVSKFIMDFDSGKHPELINNF